PHGTAQTTSPSWRSAFTVRRQPGVGGQYPLWRNGCNARLAGGGLRREEGHRNKDSVGAGLLTEPLARPQASRAPEKTCGPAPGAATARPGRTGFPVSAALLS